MLWKPAAHTAGGQTDSRGRRAAYRTIQPALHVPASTQIFFLGGLPSRMLKSLLCTPAAGQTLRRKLLSISRRQNSNRIVFLLGKKQTNKKSFPVSETVFKMSSMLLSSCLQLCFSNWTSQIMWMPAQIIWQRLDCWQVGCCFGNFQLKKSLQNPKRANRLLTGW